jgi:hypothetical protein
MYCHGLSSRELATSRSRHGQDMNPKTVPRVPGNRRTERVQPAPSYETAGDGSSTPPANLITCFQTLLTTELFKYSQEGSSERFES